MSDQFKAPDDASSFNLPWRKTINESDIDGLGQAVLTLTKEIWILTDRVATMEAVLAKRGIDITDDIESFESDDEMKAKLNERGKKLVAEVSNALSGLSSS